MLGRVQRGTHERSEDDEDAVLWPPDAEAYPSTKRTNPKVQTLRKVKTACFDGLTLECPQLAERLGRLLCAFMKVPSWSACKVGINMYINWVDFTVCTD